MKTLVVTEASTGQRLDNFLIRRCKGVPKTLLYRLLRQGTIRVNKKRAKPDTRIEEGDVIILPQLTEKIEQAPPTLSIAQAKIIRECVLYEDEDYCILNKPASLAVHGGTGISIGLIEQIRQAFDKADQWELAHRLDRGTSGVIVVAKNRPALLHFQALQQAPDGVKKTYYVLVEGRWPKQVHKVDVPLKKLHLQSGGHRVVVDPTGKPSLTTFSLLEKYEKATLLSAHLHTGRTHQIRVHCQHIGHPIIGDEKYAQVREQEKHLGCKLPRLFLHAAQLSFVSPSGARIKVVAPCEPTWDTLLTQISTAG